MDVFIIIILIIWVGFIIFGLNKISHRARQIEDIARNLDISYSEKESLNIIEPIKFFNAFARIISKRIINFMQGEIDEISYSVFDYHEYSGDGGDNIKTMILFKSESLNLPHFVLRPKNIKTMLKNILKKIKINLNNPDFDDKFHLESKDKVLITNIIGDEIIDFFLNNEDAITEGFEQYLLFYRNWKLIKPDDLENFINDGLELYNLFIKRMHNHGKLAGCIERSETQQ